jgi:hypothetical protein
VASPSNPDPDSQANAPAADVRESPGWDPPEQDAPNAQPASHAAGSTPWLLDQVETIRRIASTPITPALALALRRQHEPNAAAMILAIAAVQHRAVEKFGPGVWMATEKSIAQATDRAVARYKATLFGGSTVYDLCSGIGGDAMELAKRGGVVAVDLEPQIVAMAATNLKLDALLRRDPTSQATAVCGNASLLSIPTDAAIHIDPDRRPAGLGRVVRPTDYQSTFDQVARIVGDRRPAIVKLAPAAPLDSEPESGAVDRLVAGAHRQWISLDGSVREQALLIGECVSWAGVVVGGRSAVRVWPDGRRECFAIDAAQAARLNELDQSLEMRTEVPTFIIDIDPAVRAAGLSSSIALARNWATLGGPSGFLCSDVLPPDRTLAQVFETIWSGPPDLKRLKRHVRDRRLWVECVKVRGTGQDPQAWTRTLRSGISRDQCTTAVLFLGRLSTNQSYAALAQLPPTHR